MVVSYFHVRPPFLETYCQVTPLELLVLVDPSTEGHEVARRAPHDRHHEPAEQRPVPLRPAVGRGVDHLPHRRRRRRS